MKWKRVKNRDVIDVRGSPGGRSRRGSGGGPGGGSLPIPGSIAGIGGGAGLIAVLVIVAINVLGGSGGFDLQGTFGTGNGAPGAGSPSPIPPEEDPQRDLKDFSTYVFADAQDTWRAILESEGDRYPKAEMVLYSGAMNTEGCGGATSAVGPFYCPADQRVYLDLSFYDEMERQLGGGGDFAWAYVIAHEIGHHIQRIIGTAAEVDRLSSANPGDANELSVRQELQADCYAGVWGATVFADGDLEAGDLNEAFTTAEAIGDDRLQEQAGGRVNPDSFTHGTAEQRRRWFEAGYESGEPAACDTFSIGDL